MNDKPYVVYYLPYDHDAYGLGDIIPISDPDDHPVDLKGALDMVEDAKEEYQYEMEDQEEYFRFDDQDIFVIKEANEYDQNNWNTTGRAFSVSGRAMEEYENGQLLNHTQTVYLNQNGETVLYNGYSQEDDLYRDYNIQALETEPEGTFTVVQENYPAVRGSGEIQWDSDIEQNTVWQEQGKTVPVEQIKQEQKDRIGKIRHNADWRKAKLEAWLNRGMDKVLEADNLPEEEKKQTMSKVSPELGNRSINSFDRKVHEYSELAEEVHRFDEVMKRAQGSSGITSKVGGEAGKEEELDEPDHTQKNPRNRNGGK